MFSSPQSYNVETTAGQPLGTLSQGFVDRLVEGVSCFLLGGRPWAVLRISHDDRRLIVEAAPRGKKPTWGGFIPSFLGFDLCQQIGAVLTSAQSYAYLDAEAVTSLTEERLGMDGITPGPRGGIIVGEGEIRWWTFAGGRINSTLRHGLEALGASWKIVPDNFGLTIRGEDLTQHAFSELLDRLLEPEVWEHEKLWRDVAEGLPSYRLSKFQPLMPAWVERESLASYLLDVGGAARWLTGRAPTRLPDLAGPAPTEAPILDPTPATEPPQPEREAPGQGRVRWIATSADFLAMCDKLKRETVLGFDVETTMYTHILCLMQIACADAVYIVDALSVTDLAPIAPILSDPAIIKVIHNATFERTTLRRYDLEIDGVVDTLVVSRRLRGKKAGSHSLKAVCARELGVEMDKADQTSDWTQRPLSPTQRAYAALDAEILLHLHAHFGAPTPDTLDPQTRLPGA